MTNIEVEVVRESIDTNHIVKKLKIGSLGLITPLRAIDARLLCRLPQDVANKLVGLTPIIEYYRIIPDRKIIKLVSGAEYIPSINYQIKKVLRCVTRYRAPFLFIPVIGIKELRKEFTGEEALKRIIEFLIDTQEPSPISAYISPSLRLANELVAKYREKLIDLYGSIIDIFLEYIKTGKKKPIGITIPLSIVPYQYLRGILEYLFNEGINFLVFDMGARVPINYYQYFALTYRVANEVFGDYKFLLYVANPNIGKPSKLSEVVTAKDLLSYGIGIDILGDKHTNRAVFLMKGEDVSGTDISMPRILSRKDYGYYRLPDLRNMRKLIDPYTIIPRDPLISEERDIRSMWRRAYNTEQVGKETRNLNELIIKNESLIKYLKPKFCVKEEHVKIIVKAKESVRGGKLI